MEHFNFQLENFTLRVYGILIDDKKGILVADETQAGKRFTKFPGGGLKLGEGIKDCLIREWKEELGQTIEVMSHFYTTDFFQISAFNPKHQLISFYYLVKTLDQPRIKISDRAFDFSEEKEIAESFRWIAWNDFHEGLLTFPVDKLVAKMIGEIFQRKF